MTEDRTPVIARHQPATDADAPQVRRCLNAYPVEKTAPAGSVVCRAPAAYVIATEVRSGTATPAASRVRRRSAPNATIDATDATAATSNQIWVEEMIVPIAVPMDGAASTSSTPSRAATAARPAYSRTRARPVRRGRSAADRPREEEPGDAAAAGGGKDAGRDVDSAIALIVTPLDLVR